MTTITIPPTNTRRDTELLRGIGSHEPPTHHRWTPTDGRTGRPVDAHIPDIIGGF